MQASVHSFDPDTETGALLLDDGRVLAFDAAVFAASGLLHLRLGQRVSIELTPQEMAQENAGGKGAWGTVGRLWIVGIGEGEHIR
ncbi:MAG: hypothetical protein WA962_06775 [Ornithinimicrobium sp.]